MGYHWPSIIQLVEYGLVAVLSVVQVILSIVAITVGWWPAIGAIVHGLATLGYTVTFFFIHKRSGSALVSTKMDIIACAVLAISGLIVGIFCGMVAIGTFVILLINVVFESVYVGTRKTLGKWNMTLYDLSVVDMKGSSAGTITDSNQQWA